jgi:ankyrin repeat protein
MSQPKAELLLTQPKNENQPLAHRAETHRLFHQEGVAAMSLEENLHRACERKDPYLVNQLIAQGADIGAPDPKRNNITPLIP